MELGARKILVNIYTSKKNIKDQKLFFYRVFTQSSI